MSWALFLLSVPILGFLTHKIRTQQIKRNKTKARTAELSAQSDTLEVGIDQLKKQWCELQTEIDSLMDSNGVLEAVIVEIRKPNNFFWDNFPQSVNTFTTRVNSFSSMIRNLKADSHDADAELEIAEAELKTLETDLKQLQSSIGISRDRLRYFKEKITALKKLVKNFEAQARDSATIVANLRTKVNTIREMLNGLSPETTCFRVIVDEIVKSRRTHLQKLEFQVEQWEIKSKDLMTRAACFKPSSLREVGLFDDELKELSDKCFVFKQTLDTFQHEACREFDVTTTKLATLKQRLNTFRVQTKNLPVHLGEMKIWCVQHQKSNIDTYEQIDTIGLEATSLEAEIVDFESQPDCQRVDGLLLKLDDFSENLDNFESRASEHLCATWYNTENSSRWINTTVKIRYLKSRTNRLKETQRSIEDDLEQENVRITRLLSHFDQKACTRFEYWISRLGDASKTYETSINVLKARLDSLEILRKQIETNQKNLWRQVNTPQTSLEILEVSLGEFETTEACLAKDQQRFWGQLAELQTGRLDLQSSYETFENLRFSQKMEILAAIATYHRLEQEAQAMNLRPIHLSCLHEGPILPSRKYRK